MWQTHIGYILRQETHCLGAAGQGAKNESNGKPCDHILRIALRHMHWSQGKTIRYLSHLPHIELQHNSSI